MDIQEKFRARLNAVGMVVGHATNGLIRFEFLTARAARHLLGIGAADPEDAQNSSPTFLEFAEWLEKHPSFAAHGYIVGPKRDDERITIEGVISMPDATLTKDDITDFSLRFKDADEFDIDDSGCRAWYD